MVALDLSVTEIQFRPLYRKKCVCIWDSKYRRINLYPNLTSVLVKEDGELGQLLKKYATVAFVKTRRDAMQVVASEKGNLKRKKGW